jgi:hypothetical protein
LDGHVGLSEIHVVRLDREPIERSNAADELETVAVVARTRAA